MRSADRTACELSTRGIMTTPQGSLPNIHHCRVIQLCCSHYSVSIRILPDFKVEGEKVHVWLFQQRQPETLVYLQSLQYSLGWSISDLFTIFVFINGKKKIVFCSIILPRVFSSYSLFYCESICSINIWMQRGPQLKGTSLTCMLCFF